MEALEHKILSAFVIVTLSLVFGFLPLLLAKKYDFSSIELLDPHDMKKEKKKFKNVVLSFLLNLGGGVLIANCFCHWLPEVREGIDHQEIDTFLPLAEVVMCAGFFFISALEEILHQFLYPHKKNMTKLKQEIIQETYFSVETVTTYTTDIIDGQQEKTEKECEKTAAQIKAAIRTVFVVFALSFHSIVEGLALSLEDEVAGVWLNTGATSLHKFVIAFSVGVELISNKLSIWTYSISIIVFSLAPAFGAVIGILLTEISYNCALQERIDLPLQILQGVATGTVLYVVFFEIIPKGKTVGGTGKQHIAAMILGFAIFLPSLYFHEDHEEGHIECH